jgi:tetratricopeptide (TPR) repeat protein
MPKKRKTCRSGPGSLKHEWLDPLLEDFARVIYRDCAHLFFPTFEQWEVWLLKTVSPVQELTIWYVIFHTWNRLCASSPHEGRAQLLREVIRYSRGMGSERAEIPRIWQSVCEGILRGGWWDGEPPETYYAEQWSSLIACHSIPEGSKTTNVAFENGERLLIEGKLGAAISAFTEAIRLEPENFDAFCARGCAHAMKRDYATAIADFTESIHLDPNKASGYWFRGSVHLWQHELDEAIADFTEAIQLAPEDAEAYFIRGCTYRMMDDLDHARADLATAKRPGFKEDRHSAGRRDMAAIPPWKFGRYI